ncbi:NAD(P)/FAD-dependent oxidoreductase [Jatrophihabitans fulvus]
MTAARVTVVGAGIAGAACAAALREHGLAVDVVERGRAPGGRMASPSVQGRRVDLGAAYLTVKDDGFRNVVDGWSRRGLVREWTDTFAVVGPDGRTSKTGPVRYAAPGGLRSLVRDLLPTGGTEVGSGREVDSLGELGADAVVLAMPDPQAARLAPDAADWVEYEPVIAVAAAWGERHWGALDAAFVNDDPDLTLVADDGSRRGDGAPVLVAHTTADRARQHLDDPAAAVVPVLAALQRLLGTAEPPRWTHTHRWGLAKPVGTHGDDPFGLVEHDGRLLGLATDSWCPEGSPRVESAWLSGMRLGHAVADRLG